MDSLKISSSVTKISIRTCSFILCEIVIGLSNKVQEADFPSYMHLSFVELDGLFVYLL